MDDVNWLVLVLGTRGLPMKALPKGGRRRRIPRRCMSMGSVEAHWLSSKRVSASDARRRGRLLPLEFFRLGLGAFRSALLQDIDVKPIVNVVVERPVFEVGLRLDIHFIRGRCHLD